MIAVKDRGAGIAAAEQELIFEPYHRGDRSGQCGAGLGLALCRAIAVAHGGSLMVRRRQGGGSCFFATLPMAETQPAQEAASAAAGSAGLALSANADPGPVPSVGLQ